jgi:hypothetical protein
MESRLRELEHRLAHAERQASVARRLASTTLALSLGLVAVLALGATRSAATQNKGTTVKAPFRVVDDRGERLMEVAAVGVPYVRVFRSPNAATPAVEMFGSRWGGGLDVRNDKGRVVAVLDTRDDGVHLAIFDNSGKVTFKRP